MKRPVRPVALVILTACLLYPGVTMLYQGLYPFVAGEYFTLVAQLGPWMDLAARLHIPPVVILLAKGGLYVLVRIKIYCAVASALVAGRHGRDHLALLRLGDSPLA